MTTALLLESMTDRSCFERLATSVLRKADSNYAAIVQTGVNATGETIVSPIDGIHLIPHSNPSHYVFVQHTTTDRSGLCRKWLTDERADLSRAVIEAKRIRQELPNAKFTVVLCTNQRLDKDLVKEVIQAAIAKGVGVDIWEQHRIADFLDTTADGHWLRKIYLGVEPERLSEDLLRDLCRQSVEQYRREVLLPDHSSLVHRGNVDQILGVVGLDECSLCFVRGESGFGKSTACLQAVERRLCAGRIAMALSATAGRLAIVVDDINRTADPVRIVRTLVGATAPWGNETSGPSGKDQAARKSSVFPLVLVVPTNGSGLPLAFNEDGAH